MVVSKTKVVKVDPEPDFCGYQRSPAARIQPSSLVGVSSLWGLRQGSRDVRGVIRGQFAIMCNSLFPSGQISVCKLRYRGLVQSRRAWQRKITVESKSRLRFCLLGGWNGGDVDNSTVRQEGFCIGMENKNFPVLCFTYHTVMLAVSWENFGG